MVSWKGHVENLGENLADGSAGGFLPRRQDGWGRQRGCQGLLGHPRWDPHKSGSWGPLSFCSQAFPGHTNGMQMILHNLLAVQQSGAVRYLGLADHV